MTDEQMTQLAINTIRTLSIDAVQQAKSGHPGTPMALAPLIYTIWNRVMRFDPEDAIWPNRDRFVLSNGHASMLLWSILHLTQVRAVTAALVSIAKERGIATVLVGHVTKDGQVAGPRVLEHLVDVVLHFEGGQC